MYKSALILPGLILSLCLASCGGDIDGFTGQGSSSTNIISDKNFSVFFDETNPAVVDDDGGHADVEVNITIAAADRLDAATSGNTVYIKSQWGILDSLTCTITNGSCSVKWTSSSDFSFIPLDLYNTITVYTLGEESFTDLNGNGYFDDGDLFLRDLPEPFHDLDHDTVYTTGTDEIIDLDNNGRHTLADGRFNGAGCVHSTLCGTQSRIYIFDHGYMDLFTGTTPPTPTPTFTVTIDTPNNLDTFAFGDNINFTATASDPEDGAISGTDNPLAGDDITWASDLDGPIGTSSNDINVNNLNVGAHVITVTATDSDGNTTTDSISVTITP